MKTRMTLVIAVMLLLSSGVAWGQALPSGRPDTVGMSAERIDRVGQALKAEITKGSLPGAVVLVARK